MLRDLGCDVRAGRFDVHHSEGAVVQQRRSLRLRNQSPVSIGKPPDPGIRAEERDGRVLVSSTKSLIGHTLGAAGLSRRSGTPDRKPAGGSMASARATAISSSGEPTR